jgi:hypothetical protein
MKQFEVFSAQRWRISHPMISGSILLSHGDYPELG